MLRTGTLSLGFSSLPGGQSKGALNLPYIAGEIFEFLFFPVMPSCCAQPLLFNYPHSGAGWTAAGAGSKPAIDDGVTNEQ